jgi:hypothetical protein
MEFAFESTIGGKSVVEVYSEENQEYLRIKFNTHNPECFIIYHQNKSGLAIGKVVRHFVNERHAHITNCSNSETYNLILVFKEPKTL